MLKGAEQKLRNIPSTSTEDGTAERGMSSFGGGWVLFSVKEKIRKNACKCHIPVLYYIR